MEIEKQTIPCEINQLQPCEAKDKPLDTKVKVALRVRPMIAKELAAGEQKCVKCDLNTNQVYIGKDRAFVFDKIFDDRSPQSDVYQVCAQDLALSCFKGYNATVLAYGQTGSGKTFTMGSSTTYDIKPEDVGIIPRTMREIFHEIEKRKNEAEFLVKASFLEIYNEEIQDLLDSDSTISSRRYANNSKSNSIREEKDGSINVYGLIEERVNSYEELAACLERGSIHRSTASTLMNESSSRSHGIFTIFIEMHKISDLMKSSNNPQGTNGESLKVTKSTSSTQSSNQNGKKVQEEVEFTTSKFHFVDLAGSERLKKTGASGAIMREGININRGLLALGNVISALTEDSNKYVHVPYRESKLTRILQDSLGGNSCTYMIACISPAESNFEESLNSLKYASRARNIKNKPIVNRDPQSAVISQLKQQIYELQGELLQYKKFVNMDPTQHILPKMITPLKSPLSQTLKTQDDANNEIIKDLKLKLLNSEKESNKLKQELQTSKKALNESEISLYLVQKERDLLKILSEKYKTKLQESGLTLQLEDENLQEVDGKNLFEEYKNTIEKLKNELNDKDKLNKELQIGFENLLKEADLDNQLLIAKTKEITNLKKQLKMKETLGVNPSFTENPNSMAIEKTKEFFYNVSAIKEEDEEANGVSKDLISEEDEMMEKQFETNANLHKKEINLVDVHILEKEELLRKITQSQIALENNLVEEMRYQYHSKVLNLENEIKLLERQRDETVNKTSTTLVETERSKIVNGYKQKITEMENKLKDFKKKEREQANLMKLVQNQQSKIEQLADEIKKTKIQKIDLHKKMREEQDKFEKWRATRQKEFADIKRRNQMKDTEIAKLKNENRKKDELFKKKTEELLSNFMTPDMIKQIQSGSARKNSKHPRLNINLNNLGNFEPGMLDSNPVITEKDARNLLDYCLQKIFENLEINFLISREEQSLHKSELELEEQQHKYSLIMLQKDKLEAEKGQNKEEEELEPSLLVKIQELEMQLDEIYTRVETQEEKISFQQNKIQDLNRQLSEKPRFDLEATLFKNDKLKNHVVNYQLLLRVLLGKYVNVNVEQYHLNERLAQVTVDGNELKKKLEETEQKSRLQELQYELSLTKLHKEYEEKQYFWMRQSEILNFAEDQNNGAADDKENDEDKQNGGFLTLAQARAKKQFKTNLLPGGGSPKKPLEAISNLNPILRQKNFDAAIEELKKKDKQLTDMTRKQQNSDKIIETLKRKCELLQSKYDQQKRQNAKEKYIGIEKRGDDATSVERQPANSQPGVSSSLTFTTLQPSHSPLIPNPGQKRLATETKNADGTANSHGLVQSVKNMSLSSFRDRRKEEKEKTTQTITTSGFEVSQGSNPETSTNEIGRSRRYSSNLATTVSSSVAPKGLGMPNKHTQGTPGFANQIKRQSSPSRCQTHFENPLPKNQSQPKATEADYSMPNPNNTSMEFEGNSKESFEGMSYNNNQWKNVASIDAQSGILYSVVSYGNMVYTSSNKVFKIWSLDTLKCISEVNAHSSIIKSMAIWPEKNVLLTASDKTINIWDLVSLQSIGTLRGHKEEIRTLHVANDLLISAGKGSPSNGALLTWDLRSLNPLEEREKNQDIFCMTSHKDTLFYGSRNHQVRRINLNTMDSLSPLEPPHFDAVTSLSMLKGALVSGSRDKNLRLWDIRGCFKNLRNTSYAHQDWVSVVQSNPASNLLYSGSRDGIVKVWGVSNHKLCCISDILAHSGSVNSLCSVNETSSNLFVTVSSDKMMKIWKFDADEVNTVSMNKPLSDEMIEENSLPFTQNDYIDSPMFKVGDANTTRYSDDPMNMQISKNSNNSSQFLPSNTDLTTQRITPEYF